MAVTAEDLLPEWRLRESFVKHAARAQLYRLRAALRDRSSIDDLFVSPDAATSVATRWSGRLLPRLDDLQVELNERGIDAALPDALLSATFARTNDVLPKLVNITASAETQAALPSGADLARSTVHHFIGLVEHPARDPRPFRELLGEHFSLGYTPAPISDLAALDAWVKEALSSVVASEHVIHAIDVAEASGGRLDAVVRMTSQALFPDGSGAISRNTQRWSLHYTPGDRFPRIERIDIARDAVEFFGPAPHYEPRERP